MLLNAYLGQEFWAETVNTVSFLVNRYPYIAIEYKTPKEVWSGNPVDYSSLRVFGCPAYAHVNEGKLESKEMHLSWLWFWCEGLWCANQ